MSLLRSELSLKTMLTLTLVITVCHVTANTASAHTSKPFSFAGFTPQMTITELKAQYPEALIEERFNEKWRTIEVKFSKRRQQDQLSLVRYSYYMGKFETVLFSFQREFEADKSESYYRNSFNRFPACVAILPLVSKEFGKPKISRNTAVELWTDSYEWQNHSHITNLFCHRDRSGTKGKLWASDIIIQIRKN